MISLDLFSGDAVILFSYFGIRKLVLVTVSWDLETVSELGKDYARDSVDFFHPFYLILI